MGRLFAGLAAAAMLAGAAMLATAIGAAASPSLTVSGLNKGPRTGPDGSTLYECPLTVTYSGGAPSGSVNVDVISVSPTTPTGKSVLANGPKTVSLNSSGSANVIFSTQDFDFSGFVSTPPSDDNYKIQVVVSPGPTTMTFWVADCVPEGGTPGSSSSTPTSASPTSSPPTSTAGSVETNVATTPPSSASGNAAVLGQQIVAAPAPAQAAAPSVAVQGATQTALPKTGSNTTGWLISSIALLVLGAGLALCSRIGRATR
jgi:LPXTG-motif cell wall-anchored protein